MITVGVVVSACYMIAALIVGVAVHLYKPKPTTADYAASMLWPAFFLGWPK